MCAVPVAVPTGRYDVTLSIDLSPIFGVVTAKKTLDITRPGPDALDKRITELASEDKQVRQTALFDLMYFPKDGEKIFAALLPLLDDPDSQFRGCVIQVMSRFAPQAVKHLDRFIEICLDPERDLQERGSAAWFLAQHAPAGEKVEKCLATLAETKDPKEKRWFEWSITTYRKRTAEMKPAEK